MKERLLDPNTTTAHWAERKLVRMGTPPIGSRRRRAAIRSSQNLPFDQLPYQCFQEARKVLQEDRQEKIAAIQKEAVKIKRLEETPVEQVVGGERRKNMRLASLRAQLQKYKILADINDPVVKRRFEDGLGKPAAAVFSMGGFFLKFLFVLSIFCFPRNRPVRGRPVIEPMITGTFGSSY